MHDEPQSLGRDLLTEALRAHWGIDTSRLEYVPVGAGSYHWVAEDVRARRWFVTADRLEYQRGTVHDSDTPDAVFGELGAAYETAAAVRHLGLSFVVSPMATKANQLVHRVGREWAVAVFPFIEGESGRWGEWGEPARRVVAAGLIGALHRTPPPMAIQRWNFDIPKRSTFMKALKELDQPWASGPYAEPARRLLAVSRRGVQDLMSHYDRLAETVALSLDEWVVTHGEPHSGNFITGNDGQMYLIDWDTVRLAPRERDLGTVAGDDLDALAAYQRSAGPFSPWPEVVELFRARWTLAEIFAYVEWFRQPHGNSFDDQASWEALAHYVSVGGQHGQV